MNKTLAFLSLTGIHLARGVDHLRGRILANLSRSFDHETQDQSQASRSSHATRQSQRQRHIVSATWRPQHQRHLPLLQKIFM